MGIKCNYCGNKSKKDTIQIEQKHPTLKERDICLDCRQKIIEAIKGER